jgi:hypothetical protein
MVLDGTDTELDGIDMLLELDDIEELEFIDTLLLPIGIIEEEDIAEGDEVTTKENVMPPPMDVEPLLESVPATELLVAALDEVDNMVVAELDVTIP